ncbi:MAG: hypothetical protein NTZ05_18850, partial [Chloroflexi bacterium]|nr:hypothetical protein [Chloroflexota bacterium]
CGLVIGTFLEGFPYLLKGYEASHDGVWRRGPVSSQSEHRRPERRSMVECHHCGTVEIWARISGME